MKFPPGHWIAFTSLNTGLSSVLVHDLLSEARKQVKATCILTCIHSTLITTSFPVLAWCCFPPKSFKKETASLISSIDQLKTKPQRSSQISAGSWIDLSAELGSPYRAITQNTLDFSHRFARLLTQHKEQQINVSNGHKVWTRLKVASCCALQDGRNTVFNSGRSRSQGKRVKGEP